MPFVLCAMGMLIVPTGCEKKAESVPSESAKPSWNDSQFKADLKVKHQERLALERTRNNLISQMTKMVDAMREKMKGQDDAAVKSALEQDAEWNSLVKRVEDLNQAIEESRARAMEVVRKHMGPKSNKKISK